MNNKIVSTSFYPQYVESCLLLGVFFRVDCTDVVRQCFVPPVTPMIVGEKDFGGLLRTTSVQRI